MALEIRSWNHMYLNALTQLWQNRQGEPRPLLPDANHIWDWLSGRVAGNTFFDREGLLLAFNADEELVGMIHAGFPPTQNLLDPILTPDAADLTARAADQTTQKRGIIMMMIVKESLEEKSRREVIQKLLQEIEVFLKGRNVRTIYGGAMRPQYNPPFWRGLCGAGDAWGIPDSDELAQEVFSKAGYQVIKRTAVWRRSLATQLLTPPEVTQAQQSLSLYFNFEVTPQDWKYTTSWEEVTANQETSPLEFAMRTPDGQTLGRLVIRQIAEVRDGVQNNLFAMHRIECFPPQGSPPSARQKMILVLWDKALEKLCQMRENSEISQDCEVEWIMCNDQTFASQINAAQLFGFEIVKQGTILRREFR